MTNDYLFLLKNQNNLQSKTQRSQNKMSWELQPKSLFSTSAKDFEDPDVDDIFEFDLLPRDIKAHLDRFVIRQDEAKKALSIAVCDHYNHVKTLKAQEEEERLARERAPPEPWEGTFETSKHRVKGQEGYAPHTNDDDIEPWSEHLSLIHI